jgi:hypothetical protein
MTLFAVMCAAIFPGIHVGRVWMAWFLIPVPVPNWIWPNFRSPLMWDVFAVSTYFTGSVLFWYLGLVPDLAMMRDRAKTQVAKVSYGLLALGWNGGNRHCLFRRDVRERGDVVRAVRDPCSLAAPRFPAIKLGHVLSRPGLMSQPMWARSAFSSLSFSYSTGIYRGTICTNGEFHARLWGGKADDSKRSC